MIAFAAGACTGFARLGESPQAVQQRYGQPVSTGVVTPFTRCVYEKDSFAITVFFRNGVSVVETFAKRGLDQATARQVAVLVAARAIASPDQAREGQLRQAAGITCKDEVFWSWKIPAPVVTPGQPPAAAQSIPSARSATAAESETAAYNPVECSLAFFSAPEIYATVQQALAAAPLAGS